MSLLLFAQTALGQLLDFGTAKTPGQLAWIDDDTVRLHTLEPLEGVGRWEARHLRATHFLNAAGDRFVGMKGKKGSGLDRDDPGQIAGTFKFELGGFETPAFAQDGRAICISPDCRYVATGGIYNTRLSTTPSKTCPTTSNEVGSER
jgi:hypothetical protein